MIRRIGTKTGNVKGITRRLIMGALFTAGTVAAAQGNPPVEKVSDAADITAVSVTIYNDALALVREQRQLDIGTGRNRIALRNVSGMIRPETAALRGLDGANFHLLEQNFDFDLLTPRKLLDKYVGRQVTVAVVNTDTGAEKRESATVLANNEGVVLKYADRIETGIPSNGRLIYDDVPANLRDRPTLVTDFESDRSGRQAAELTYLTSGLSWKADYVANLSADENTLNLSGWVTLGNRSGTTYQNALLQLVAGDVNQVRNDLMQESGRMMMDSLKAKPAMKPMAEESLFEYHLYTLERPTTIADQQTKQVALLSADSVKVVGKK